MMYPLKTVYKSLFIMVLTFCVVPLIGFAETCTFTRDLDIGVVGEDVRCLQKHLNTNGFVITKEGVGSPGRETNQYQTLTKEAVIRWQKAKGVTPATGYFGAKSRAAFSEVKTGTNAKSLEDTLKAQLVQLTAQAEVLQKQGSTTTATAITTATEQSAKKALTSAMERVKDAQTQLKRFAGVDRTRAETRLQDAYAELFTAVRAYFSNQYSATIDAAKVAEKNALASYDWAGGKGDDDKIEDQLVKAEKDIDAVWTLIDTAQKAGKNTDIAESLLEEAEDTVESAFDALDDENVARAQSLTNDVVDTIRDAKKALNASVTKNEAQTAITNARNDFKSAQSKISKAERKGVAVDDALDLMDDAEDVLAEAQDAYDDKEYTDARELTEEALDLIDEALDSI